MPKRYRDDRDPDGRRNPNLYLEARYAPSNRRYSYNRIRRYNPSEYMGRGFHYARNRIPVFRENGRYYSLSAGLGRQYLGTEMPDTRHYAVGWSRS